MTLTKEQLKRAISEKVSTIHGNTGKSAFGELILDIVQPNHLSLDLFSAFMPTTTRNPGDTEFRRRVKRGRYPVATLVPGTKHMHYQTDFQDQITWAFDRLISGVEWSVWELESGEVGTIEQFRNELRADIFDELVSRVYTLLSSLWNSTDTPNNFVDASATGLTATALDTLIENMYDITPSIRNIVGTRRALLPLYEFAQYREFALSSSDPNGAAFQIPDAFNEFSRTGKVSTYRGINVIELPQIFTNRLSPNPNATGMRTRLIPDDKVLLVGDKAGEIMLNGGTQYHDYTDPTTIPPNYVLFAYQSFGLIVDDIEKIGLIKVA